VEAFYWLAITFSQTLGTALGDWMADTTGLGYEGGAVVFAAGLAVLALAYYWTDVSRVLLFWAAFILTRPLGATVGDFLDKPRNHGGLALSRPIASAVIAVLILAAILLLPATGGHAPKQGINGDLPAARPSGRVSPSVPARRLAAARPRSRGNLGDLRLGGRERLGACLGADGDPFGADELDVGKADKAERALQIALLVLEEMGRRLGTIE